MDAVTQAISQFCQRLTHDSANLWVAYSGGMDSHVLLHALALAQSSLPQIKLKAIHVNHQLQDGSDQWARHCESACEALNVACTVIDVEFDKDSGLSPEEAARDARYAAIRQLISQDDYLLTAHHRNDQAETVLLQLMRGAGVSGLSAMTQIRQTAHYIHARPLLSIPSESIKDYAEKHSLEWINDPSNLDTDIRRNYVRHEILPRLVEQWPNAEKLISNSASHLENSKQLTDWYLSRDLLNVLDTTDVLDINKLTQYPVMVQEHLVRHWYQSLDLAQPGPDKLGIIFNEVIHAKQDAQPVLQWQSSQLLRARNKLVLLPLWPDEKPMKWSGETEVNTNYWFISLSLPAKIDPSDIVISHGEYNFSIEVNGVNRRLKDLYKEKCIPAVLRPLIPVVYYHGKIVSVPNIYTDDMFEEVAVEFDFHRMGGQVNLSQQPLISVLSND